MTKNRILLIVGLLLAVMPFLGFPDAIRRLYYIVAGVIIIAISITNHVRHQTHARRVNDVYAENSAKNS